jgi:hypothetical protein
MRKHPKTTLPAAVAEQLRKAGQRRAAQMTTADRQKYGRKAWQTRISRAKSAQKQSSL